MENHSHILLITFPAQGHINPSLQLAKKLIRMGVEVTFATSLSAHRRIATAVDAVEGLKTASFNDGYDDGFKFTNDSQQFLSAIRNRGSETLKEIIRSSAEKGHPVSCVVYTLLLPWAAQVARDMDVPSVFFWIQPATVLDIYYYYFKGYGEAMDNCLNDPSWSIELPGLPLLHANDLPSFLIPTSKETDSFALPNFKEQLEALDADINSKVLVNSFDALETEALKAIEKLKVIAIGPVLPSAFLDGKDPSDNSVGGDLYQKSRNYKDWLDLKPRESVIYVSFGSIIVLAKTQMEEIGKGLLKSGMPFLWVIRKKEGDQLEEEKLSCMEELEEQGMIVPWCSQLEVLSHPALGCFVTHCGWNSTLESLVSRVPVVAFPQWSDQTTNAKLIQDVWKTGVRVNGNEGVVDGDEVDRCLKMVMGNQEFRKNAKKWGGLAREAISEGGSSDKNLMAFVEELG